MFFFFSSLLMPSNVTTHEKAFELQMNLVKAKGIPCFMGMLTRNDFLSTADLRTKQLAYLTVLKMCKLLFAVAGHSLVHMVAEACQPDSTSTVSSSVHSQAVILQQALHQIPSPTQEVRYFLICGRRKRKCDLKANEKIREIVALQIVL